MMVALWMVYCTVCCMCIRTLQNILGLGLLRVLIRLCQHLLLCKRCKWLCISDDDDDDDGVCRCQVVWWAWNVVVMTLSVCSSMYNNQWLVLYLHWCHINWVTLSCQVSTITIVFLDRFKDFIIARCSNASVVLGVVILSACPSVCHTRAQGRSCCIIW